ncbi:Gfo/Idh/MocA family protein [Herbiconiux daphne]|uniref:Gfo/Idh/MocA family oxidoreductase n=1 Tax=Herbiconiux daphne TaxID=2970914 RepID=A0ABT2H7X7_9MICO|nr:Gfo/Idh/MocA family oxidoreductase [Herbiconiux daphne]MCS5736024.1 Gfo/Idh/MocA family oxidoreductase [Herbiconiux daphne]
MSITDDDVTVSASPIRAAVIGYGLGGETFHAPLIAADPAYRLAAVVTSNPERAGRATERYGAGVVVTDADSLFERAGDLDLVVVTSPNATHVPLARRAIDAGLDVVVDKPFALTEADATELIAHAERAGRRLTVFQNRRWDGDFLTLRTLIENGDLGEVRQFESAFEWFKPSLSAKNKDVDPADQGGGILFDLGPHLIDQALQLFGEVTAVHAELDARRAGAVSDDDSFVSLQHANGVRSRLWMSAVAPGNRPRFRVVGSKAVFASVGLDPQERQAKAGMSVGDHRFGMDEISPYGLVIGPDAERQLPKQRGTYSEFYRLLAEALVTGRPVPVDPRDSETVLRIIEEAHRQNR